MSDPIVQNTVFTLLAALLGLSLGWLLWGRRASRMREEAALLQDRVNQLEPLPARIEEISRVQIAALAAKDKRIEEIQKRVDSEVAQLRGQMEAAVSRNGEIRLRLEGEVNEARLALTRRARVGRCARKHCRLG